MENTRKELTIIMARSSSISQGRIPAAPEETFTKSSFYSHGFALFLVYDVIVAK